MESETYPSPSRTGPGLPGESGNREQRELVQRILKSPPFEKSPRLREFLSFITERTWSGDVDSLKEQVIGYAVFKRHESYDPVGDNIVRVQARQLRLKLEEYYAGEGKGESLRLSVPKGKYLPVFERNMPATRERDKVKARQPARSIIIVAVAILSVLSAILIGRVKLAERGGGPLFWPWTELLDGQRRTIIVVSDPTVSLIRLLTGKEVRLKDYAASGYPQSLFPPDAPIPIANTLAFAAAQRTTSAADLMIGLQIVRLLGARADHVTVRLARDARYRELQENNVIVVGTAWGSNPWAELYERRLNFQSAWDPALARPVFKNVSPKPGEQPEYITVTRTPNPGKAYAVAALLKHPDHGGSVLLIQGATMEASEGAGKLLTNEGPATQLRKQLGAHARHFEVLLEMEAVSGTATLSNVLATRIHP
ncbi:MAG: hypothetical protein IT161_02170 [Bryobacterales bacterium]|nr:hypothetical protein [Bryobacterales bacterium]